MIHVTPLSKLDETLARSGARHLVTLMKEGDNFSRPASLESADHLMLHMHDIVEEMPGLVAPSQGHVSELLDFARRWDRRTPLAINCYAGISRSTAAAYIVAAALSPNRDEMELARQLRDLSPSATPNIRLIALADVLLGRNGRMIDAIRSIGRGCDAFEGAPFVIRLLDH